LPSTGQDSVLDTSVLSTKLFAVQELGSRARLVAELIAELIPHSAVTVYTLDSGNSQISWVPRATIGEATIHEESIHPATGVLGSLLQKPTPVFRIASLPKREDYPHVDARRTVRSLCYIPLLHTESIFGTLEILSFQDELSDTAISGLLPVAQVAAAALASAQAYESERNSNLSAITRLTQLYDLEKVFSSTLDMDELLPIVGSKFLEIMECEAINLWLLKPDESLELMHQAGRDATTHIGAVQRPGEGIPGNVSDDGVPVLINNPNDERLLSRNVAAGDSPIVSLLVVPIMDSESLVGVVEATNKNSDAPFNDDDLFALTSITETASIALHNASLLLAERKVEILETLVTVSHEITSTLNLERMLQTIVNAPQAVIPYERAALTLEQRGRFKLSAVTGVMQVNADAPEIAPLNEVLQWVALSEEVVHVRQHDEEIDATREETRDKFRKYFRESGMRGFYAMPLNDDTGRVGVLSLESSDPDFLEPAHFEILQVLAGQATVALRNAQMYKEVPFISVLEPMLERKRRFMALEKRRRAIFVGLTGAAIFFLAICPLPMRVDGDAIIAPIRRAQVQPEFEGVVGKVFVREGETVTRGQILAEMEAWDYRSALAEAEAKYQSAILQMNRSLASNDGGEAGIQRVQADYWKAAVEREKELVARAQLRSPIDGVVSTPHVENLAGRRLQYGETFAEVVDASSTVADVAIDDADASLLQSGAKAVVKLNSYPMHTFRGKVIVVSPKSEQRGDSRVFFARVLLPNEDGSVRTGMEGRGKISIGWYPAGYVLFRRPILWLYSRMWSWVGW
jgi:RND family efflux transporter MFP subunit